MTLQVADGIEIVIEDEKLYSWQQEKEAVKITMKNGCGVDHYEYDAKHKTFQYKSPVGMGQEQEIEMLAGYLYNHLCSYSPLKEFLRGINLDGETYTKEIKFALNEWFKEE